MDEIIGYCGVELLVTVGWMTCVCCYGVRLLIDVG